MYIGSIRNVMVRVLTSSAVDREPWSGQTIDCKIGICCFCAKNAALKSKDWLDGNQDNESEWSNMYICGLTVISVSVLV